MITEPEDGGYVAVKPNLSWTDAVQVYRRDDASGVLGRNWAMLGGPRTRRTWTELTQLGEIAYVGQFVDRKAS